MVVLSSVANGKSGSAASKHADGERRSEFARRCALASAAESGAITSAHPAIHTANACHAKPDSKRKAAGQRGQRGRDQPGQEASSASHTGRSSRRTREAAFCGT